MTDTVHIIAEAGTAHEGNAETAVRLLQAAKSAGADSVKYQFINPAGLYLTQLRREGTLEANPVVEARRKQQLSPSDWKRVAGEARKAGIAFSASVFDRDSLDFLLEFDPPYVKIASTDVNNDRLLQQTAATGKRILLSTGMSPLGEIEHAVETLAKSGCTDVVLLHCVSVYPCPTGIANVGFVATLRQCFGLPVGYSDHTENSVAAIAAIALGASWIEKHLTLDRKAQGFDHAYAMEPQWLAAFIADLRAAEETLVPRLPKVGAQEDGVRQRARRSLWVARDLPAGHVLSESDILVVRPAGPLTPVHLPEVVGRRLGRALKTSEAIRFEDLA